MNASSNASVGKLRKHPCGALGAGKQQRLAAGGSRGAHVARLASVGARGAWRRTLKRVHSLKVNPFSCTQVSLPESLGPLRRGVKSSGPQNTGVTLYRPFKNAKCRKCTRALEAANVAQLVHEAQFGRRSIHLQLAKGPSWRDTAPECSLLVCIAHLAVQACFRLQRHSRVASGPGLCLWAPALRQHLRFDKLSSEVAVAL